MSGDCLPHALVKTIFPPRTIATEADGTPVSASVVVTSASICCDSSAVSACASAGAETNSASAATAERNGFMEFPRSEEHTSELQSLMRISYAVFCLKKKKETHVRIRQRAHKNNEQRML